MTRKDRPLAEGAETRRKGKIQRGMDVCIVLNINALCARKTAVGFYPPPEKRQASRKERIVRSRFVEWCVQNHPSPGQKTGAWVVNGRNTRITA